MARFIAYNRQNRIHIDLGIYRITDKLRHVLRKICAPYSSSPTNL
jgi:hypothetical protein